MSKKSPSRNEQRYYDLNQLEIEAVALRDNIQRLESSYSRMSDILDKRNIGKNHIMELEIIVAILASCAIMIDEIIREIAECKVRDRHFPW